jgi:hypothetical protein
MPERESKTEKTKRKHCCRSERRHFTLEAAPSMSFVRAIGYIEGAMDCNAKQADKATRQ